MNAIKKLEEWYASNCEPIIDGETPWQHRYGIKIRTIDNPGWTIGIDLERTRMSNVTVPQYIYENGDDDWYRCQIVDNVFSGFGDPSKLSVMIEWFFLQVDMYEHDWND